MRLTARGPIGECVTTPAISNREPCPLEKDEPDFAERVNAIERRVARPSDQVFRGGPCLAAGCGDLAPCSRRSAAAVYRAALTSAAVLLCW